MKDRQKKVVASVSSESVGKIEDKGTGGETQISAQSVNKTNENNGIALNSSEKKESGVNQQVGISVAPVEIEKPAVEKTEAEKNADEEAKRIAEEKAKNEAEEKAKKEAEKKAIRNVAMRLGEFKTTLAQFAKRMEVLNARLSELQKKGSDIPAGVKLVLSNYQEYVFGEDAVLAKGCTANLKLEGLPEYKTKVGSENANKKSAGEGLLEQENKEEIKDVDEQSLREGLREVIDLLEGTQIKALLPALERGEDLWGWMSTFSAEPAIKKYLFINEEEKNIAANANGSEANSAQNSKELEKEKNSEAKANGSGVVPAQNSENHRDTNDESKKCKNDNTNTNKNTNNKIKTVEELVITASGFNMLVGEPAQYSVRILLLLEEAWITLMETDTVWKSLKSLEIVKGDKLIKNKDNIKRILEKFANMSRDKKEKLNPLAKVTVDFGSALAFLKNEKERNNARRPEKNKIILGEDSEGRSIKERKATLLSNTEFQNVISGRTKLSKVVLEYLYEMVNECMTSLLKKMSDLNEAKNEELVKELLYIKKVIVLARKSIHRNPINENILVRLFLLQNNTKIQNHIDISPLVQFCKKANKLHEEKSHAGKTVVSAATIGQCDNIKIAYQLLENIEEMKSTRTPFWKYATAIFGCFLGGVAIAIGAATVIGLPIALGILITLGIVGKTAMLGVAASLIGGGVFAQIKGIKYIYNKKKISDSAAKEVKQSWVKSENRLESMKKILRKHFLSQNHTVSSSQCRDTQNPSTLSDSGNEQKPVKALEEKQSQQALGETKQTGQMSEQPREILTNRFVGATAGSTKRGLQAKEHMDQMASTRTPFWKYAAAAFGCLMVLGAIVVGAATVIGLPVALGLLATVGIVGKTAILSAAIGLLGGGIIAEIGGIKYIYNKKRDSDAADEKVIDYSPQVIDNFVNVVEYFYDKQKYNDFSTHKFSAMAAQQSNHVPSGWQSSTPSRSKLSGTQKFFKSNLTPDETPQTQAASAHKGPSCGR